MMTVRRGGVKAAYQRQGDQEVAVYCRGDGRRRQLTALTARAK